MTNTFMHLDMSSMWVSYDIAYANVNQTDVALTMHPASMHCMAWKLAMEGRMDNR